MTLHADLMYRSKRSELTNDTTQHVSTLINSRDPNSDPQAKGTNNYIQCMPRPNAMLIIYNGL